MENEIWMDIIEGSSLYQCSNFGNFRKKNKDKRSSEWRHLKGSVNPRGYVHIKIKGVSTLLAHRIVASTFLLKKGHTDVLVNHIDLNKSNNRVDNLEWCDQKHNVNHSVKLGSYGKSTGKQVTNSLTGEVYKSIVEASKHTGIPYGTLEFKLRGGKSHKNLSHA